ncbi:MAG: GNAT family N-acetyltransferase [Clostridiales bacterium]|nr:GNAT family N-acetyltransferase [Clostridiales bacterium]
MIERIAANKKAFLPLLLLGDESESQIDAYLQRGELYVLFDGEYPAAAIAVTVEGDGVIEIQNLATDPGYRRRGYASRLVEFVAARYWFNQRKLILGTGDVSGILRFYGRLGFEVTHRIPDYFTTHYEQPIIEDGIVLKDKVYMERRLQ